MTSPTTPTRSPGILARAKQLGAGALLAVTPLAASATSLTLDYSRAGDYSNSGWFIGSPSDENVDGLIINDGFKLWGTRTLTDADFWRYDQYEERTVPRYDFTGVAFAWGGKITGGTTWEDQLVAPFDFTVSFTNEAINSYTSVNVALRLGYSTNPYEFTTEPGYNQSIPSNSGSYNYWSTSYDKAGDYHETGSLSTGLTESAEDLYWFAVLTVDWNNEFVSSRWWEGSYQTLNGDTMTITVPQNSIDVTYDPATPDTPPTSVPDTGSTLSLFGVALGCLAWFRRRR